MDSRHSTKRRLIFLSRPGVPRPGRALASAAPPGTSPMSAWSCVESGAVAAALGEELGAWSGAEGVRGLRGVGPAGRVEPSRGSTITRCLPRQPARVRPQGNAEKKPSKRPVAAPMSHRDRLGLAFKLDPDKAVVLASHLSLMPLPLRRV